MLQYTSETELNQVEVQLEDQVVLRNSSVRCLGVWIDDKLSWKDHITRVRQKYFGALPKLRRYMKVLPTRESFFRLLYCHMQITVQLCGRNVLRNYGQRLRES